MRSFVHYRHFYAIIGNNDWRRNGNRVHQQPSDFQLPCWRVDSVGMEALTRGHVDILRTRYATLLRQRTPGPRPRFQTSTGSATGPGTSRTRNFSSDPTA